MSSTQLDDQDDKEDQNRVHMFNSGGLGERTFSSRSKPQPLSQRLRTQSKRSFPTERQERLDIIPRSYHRVIISKKLVLQTANDHDRYVIGGTTLRNLPIYDDCTMYNATPPVYARLLEIEIDQLIAFATSDSPPLFNSQGCLGGLSRKDFEDVSGLADQILCNMAILDHDNSRHGIEIPTIASEAWDILISSRKRLRTRYAQDESHVEGRQPTTLSDPNDNQVAYHQLLDYILGTIAWWILRSADSEYWRRQLLAILARWAVKMKLVLRDPVLCADISLAETKTMIEHKKFGADFKEVVIKFGGKEQDIDVLETEFDLSSSYFVEKLLLRQHLGKIMETVLEALSRHERSGIEAESFEICSMIHRSGLEGVASMLTGQRHGNIVASSNLQHINFCYSIFKFLEYNTVQLEAIDKKIPSPSPVEAEQNCLKVVMACNTGENGDTSKFDFALRRMDDAISLIVPLALMDPQPASQIASLMNLTNMLADPKDPIRQFAPPPRNFAAEYTIATKTWNAQWQRRGKDRFMDPDIKQLSQSPLRRGVKDDYLTLSEDSTTNPIVNLLADYQANTPEMSKWVISASSITVNCRKYATIVQVAVVILILGALSLPFTVRDRIPGVDPFQMTLFVWLLCGASLIIAKSRYVSSWPWHDFLRGWVVCRTISDLSDVSGVDPQVILLFLLHNEWSSFLVSDGPYNGMFVRKTAVRSVSETKNEEKRNETMTHQQGFSIDVPVHLITMLTSGFVVLKARNSSGEHLICIDGRKGTWDAAMQERRGHWLTCPGFNRDGLENVQGSGIKEEDTSKKIHILRRVHFTWTKILGIYIKDARFG